MTEPLKWRWITGPREINMSLIIITTEANPLWYLQTCNLNTESESLGESVHTQCVCNEKGKSQLVLYLCT